MDETDHVGKYRFVYIYRSAGKPDFAGRSGFVDKTDMLFKCYYVCYLKQNGASNIYLRVCALPVVWYS